VRASEHVELEAVKDLFAIAPPEVGASAREAGAALAVRTTSWLDARELNRGRSSSGGLAPLEARTDLRIGKPEEPEHFGRVFALGYGFPEVARPLDSGRRRAPAVDLAQSSFQNDASA
jgi:hypothetical protein